jgi:hypothetical protein
VGARSQLSILADILHHCQEQAFRPVPQNINFLVEQAFRPVPKQVIENGATYEF